MYEIDIAMQAILLRIARTSIAYGLERQGPADFVCDDLHAALRQTRASFVTLRRGTALRGCIGSLEAQRPLAEDVHQNAYAAAFRDPRFPPLQADEWPNIHLSLSVLSCPEALFVADEAGLWPVLRPGVDGLILEYKQHRATFLPAVWQSLPQAEDFVRELKLKAGLGANFWDEKVRVYRYTCSSFE